MANEIKNNIYDTSSFDKEIERTILNCYGVCGIDYGEEDKKGNADRGLVIRRFADSKLALDVYLIIAQDIKITEVLRECQNQLKYVLDNKFKGTFKSINVYAKQLQSSINVK